MKRLPLIVHLLLSLLGLAAIIVGVAYYLDNFTNHGKIAEVPNVQAKSLKDAIKTLEDKGFEVEVDSTYRDSLPALYVIKQYPNGGDKVKMGRTIQLIVNKAAPPMVAMPSLLGARVTSALQYLERNNLKLADTIFKPDFAVNRILQQLVDGKEVKAGTMLKYGTKVTLVIGSGTGSIIYNYPDFYGMTLRKALEIMDTLGLSRGAISIDAGTKDSLNAIVYKQYPEPLDPYTQKPTLIKQGNTVDLFISNTPKPREVDTTKVYIDETMLEDAKTAEEEYSAEDVKDGKKTGKKKLLKRKTTTSNAATLPKKTQSSTTNPNDY
jgi:beta-lactam-binding protein with PASTA domain